MATSRRNYSALLALLVLAGCTSRENLPEKQPAPFSYPPGAVEPFVAQDRVQQLWAADAERSLPERVPVRGIYVSSWHAADPVKFQELLGLVARTELNAMVIDVKDDSGFVTFLTDHPVARAAGVVKPDLGDVRAFTAGLRNRGVYSIARVVTFKDNFVPRSRPELAVSSRAGGPWRDYNRVTWLNPYNRHAWEYVVDIAKAAAVGGFDEVQFDYVRFPTDGDLDSLVYPGRDSRRRERVIAEFLAYARKELRPYGVWVSADVFGLVTSTDDDMGIGQRLEEVSESVDYLSPMVYPSHYERGNLGVANPNAMPYETVHRSMLDARDRWEQAGQNGKVIMRPWLQDFSWGHPYGPAEIRAQIQATYDAGFAEWLLWNAANEYTEGALKPAGKE